MTSASIVGQHRSRPCKRGSLWWLSPMQNAQTAFFLDRGLSKRGSPNYGRMEEGPKALQEQFGLQSISYTSRKLGNYIKKQKPWKGRGSHPHPILRNASTKCGANVFMVLHKVLARFHAHYCVRYLFCHPILRPTSTHLCKISNKNRRQIVWCMNYQ